MKPNGFSRKYTDDFFGPSTFSYGKIKIKGLRRQFKKYDTKFKW